MLVPILLSVGLGLMAGVMAALILAARRPNELRVVRSAYLDASPEVVYPILTDFHRFAEWSPWERRDPGMARRHSGASSGVGAVYEWEGNSQVGQGRLTIVEAEPCSVVRLRLEFLKPFAATNRTEYRLEAEGNGTRMTWTMVGPQPFLGKVMDLVMDMDRMIGRDFEEGLANLQRLVGPSQPS